MTYYCSTLMSILVSVATMVMIYLAGAGVLDPQAVLL